MLQLLDSANKQLSSFTKSPDHIDVNNLPVKRVNKIIIYLFIYFLVKEIHIFIIFKIWSKVTE